MAYQDASYDHPKKEEIKKRLEYEANFIFSDQMDQLFAIIAQRMYEPELDALYNDWKVPDGRRTNEQNIKMIQDLPLSKRAAFLKTVRNTRKELGTEQWFSETGRWASLLHKYIELSSTGRDLKSLIMSIDRIYGLCHHGGMLADHFDERRWLEDALHTRSIGSPSQILSQASSDVRELIGRDSSSSPVIPAQKIKLALDKYTKGVAHTGIDGDSTTAVIPITIYLEYYHRASRPEPVMIVRADVGDCKSGDSDSDGDEEMISKRVKILNKLMIDCHIKCMGTRMIATVNGQEYSFETCAHIKGQMKPSNMAYNIVVAAKEQAYNMTKRIIPDGATRLL